MSEEDILSQDEIDALLHGVDSGDVESGAGTAVEGEVQSFDLANPNLIVRGRLPRLEMINERFARHLRLSLFNMLRRTTEVSVSGVDMIKFQDYMRSLPLPTSLNVISVPPLRGTSLMVLDARLIFALVDCYFGGDGSLYARIEGREFTPVETRIIERLRTIVFDDLKEAWKPVMDIDFQLHSMEVNPQFANIVSPSELVVISRFEVEIEGATGEVHFTIPYSTIEPIREALDSGVASDRTERDERWVHALREEIRDAPMDLSVALCRKRLTLRDLVHLRPGDVIPIDPPDCASVLVEGVPCFEGRVGVSRGKYAISIVRPLDRRPG